MSDYPDRTAVPVVDVVIPVRNRPRLVQVCLDGVRGQSLQPNAVIVVDDGSTDETPTVLADYASRWSKLRVIRTGHRGAAHARNLGLGACRAPFVAFLDSDDVWCAEKLERQLALFAGRPEVGLVHCACFEIDERGERLCNTPIFMPSKRGYIFEEMINTLYHLSGSASAVVARRDLVTRVGGFDESLLHVEDQDLWLKLAHISHVDFVPDALVGLRRHAGNRFQQRVDSDPVIALLQHIAVWNKWIDHANENAVIEAFRHKTFVLNEAEPYRMLLHYRFFHQLRKSELHLARRIFPNFLFYLRSHPRFFCLRSFRGCYQCLVTLYGRLKFAIANKVILQNRILLRVAQMLGKFPRY